MLAAWRDTELCAGCGNVWEGDPFSTVGGFGKVKSIAIAGFSGTFENAKRGYVVMYRAFHGLGAKGWTGGPEAMS